MLDNNGRNDNRKSAGNIRAVNKIASNNTSIDGLNDGRIIRRSITSASARNVEPIMVNRSLKGFE
jgi:hypothetical protein